MLWEMRLVYISMMRRYDMQNLEKILEEIDREIEERRKDPEMRDVDICYGLNRAKEIIRRHMNDG